MSISVKPLTIKVPLSLLGTVLHFTKPRLRSMTLAQALGLDNLLTAFNPTESAFVLDLSPMGS